MPRDPVTGVYTPPPNITAFPNGLLESGDWNALVEDVRNTFNTTTPEALGGTGFSSWQTAVESLALAVTAENKTDLTSMTVPVVTMTVSVAGFSSAGDGGAGTYFAVPNTGPLLADQVQTNSGGLRFQLTDQSMTASACGVLSSNTDNTTQLQNYFDRCVARGIYARLPKGLFNWANPVSVSTADIPFGSSGHFSIVGAGSGSTILKYNGPAGSQGLSIIGSWGVSANPYVFLNVRGLTIDGGNYLRNGLFLSRGIFLSCDDVFITQCKLALKLEDIVGLNLYNTHIVFNENGILGNNVQPLGNGNGGPYSPVNEVDLYGTHISNNRGYGAWFVKSGPINFHGGSIEANGIPGAWTAIPSNVRCDVKLTDCGHNSGSPFNAFGTHFESSAGDGCVLIEHYNYTPATYSFYGCDFIQNGPTNFVTNSIAVVSLGTGKVSVNVNSCSFMHVNGYVPDAGRRRIAAYAGGGGSLDNISVNIDNATKFSSLVDAPTNLVARSFTKESATSCIVRFTTGPTPTLLGAPFNVAAISQPAAGSYLITFKSKMDHAGFSVSGNISGAPGSISLGNVFGTPPTAIQVNTFNPAGVLANIGTDVSVSVSGGLSIS